MRKPNKRRPDRTHYAHASVSIVGRFKGVRRYIMGRGRVKKWYIPGLGPHGNYYGRVQVHMTKWREILWGGIYHR